jgi:hypothetical protein
VLRTVQPELLDSLPPGDPEALHNRRDLRLTNAIMGNFRWFRRSLPPRLQPGDRVLELGAGDGGLGRALASVVGHYAGLDQCPRPAAWPQGWAWHQADLRFFPDYANYSVVLANLILHQLSDGELVALGARLASTTRLILACEPARRRRSQWLFRTLGPMLGANRVSMHDARVSIAAGFLGDELPQRLGLDATHWDIRCRTTALGACPMIAVRRSSP